HTLDIEQGQGGQGRHGHDRDTGAGDHRTAPSRRRMEVASSISSSPEPVPTEMTFTAGRCANGSSVVRRKLLTRTVVAGASSQIPRPDSAVSASEFSMGVSHRPPSKMEPTEGSK